MKVAYFAGSLVENLDGVSRVLYKISEYNKFNSIDSVFISPETDPRIGQPSVALKGIRLPVYHEYKFATSGLSYIEEKLKEKNFTPDLIHVHSPCPTGFAGVKLAKKLKIPVVATYHTHFPAYLKYHRAQLLLPFVKKYMRYFYKQCDEILVPSATIKAELEAMGITNTRVLPHGVDFTVFNKEQYQPILKKAEGDKKILLYAGRLVWEKNLEVLIKAINQLSEKRNDFVLWIAGKGSAEVELKKRLKNAKFLGFCEGKKLGQVYATSDVFIFPSASETFGNVTLEAMASHTACVVANASGSSDLIQDGKNGLLFDPEDADELADQIEELLDHEEKRSRLAAQAFQDSLSYRWKNSLDLQKEMYIDLLEKKRSPQLQEL